MYREIFDALKEKFQVSSLYTGIKYMFSCDGFTEDIKWDLLPGLKLNLTVRKTQEEVRDMLFKQYKFDCNKNVCSIQLDYKPLFIAFEGIDGSGKTTLSKSLTTILDYLQIPFVLTKEPTFDKSSLNKDLSPEEEFNKFFEDRKRHVEEVIKPSLKSNKVVITDRFMDSSYAYQGYGLGVDLLMIREKHKSLGIVPDITFILDGDPKVFLNRKNKHFDSIEKRSLEYFDKVRKGYLAIQRNNVVFLDTAFNDFDNNLEIVVFESLDRLLDFSHMCEKNI